MTSSDSRPVVLAGGTGDLGRRASRTFSPRGRIARDCTPVQRELGGGTCPAGGYAGKCGGGCGNPPGCALSFCIR